MSLPAIPTLFVGRIAVRPVLSALYFRVDAKDGSTPRAFVASCDAGDRPSHLSIRALQFLHYARSSCSQ